MKNWNSGINWDKACREYDFRFRYLHDKHGKIVVTICYKRIDDTLVAYGTAATSPKDNGSKEAGRIRAYSRLMKAWNTQKNKPTNSAILKKCSTLGEYGYGVEAERIKNTILWFKQHETMTDGK